ncbi:DNA polymerase theta [Musca vetustissima]|uniref:DNA polymerase theta n=1 Tax=Musca vetustissima TaxID=27455 RepID=UPI002AB60F7F|nr:DNA polymerase theta [Musca vetustissima]
MEFSQSFEFGNSTFMKLESQAKHALEGDQENRAPNGGVLDVIDESPKSNNKTSLFSSSKSIRTRNATQRTNTRTADSTYHRKFRRSKSDSTLPKAPKEESCTNYSEFFRSDFSIPNDISKAKQTGGDDNESFLRVSQIEAAFNCIDPVKENGNGKLNSSKDSQESFKFEEGDIGGVDKSNENLQNRSKDSIDFEQSMNYTNNAGDEDIDENSESLEKPIFSEDLKDLLDTEDANEDVDMWKDSLPLSAIPDNNENGQDSPEVMHEISSFLSHPKEAEENNEQRKQTLSKELRTSHKIFKESQKSVVAENDISLSHMSPDQLKFTQNSPTVSPNIKIQTPVRTKPMDKSKKYESSTKTEETKEKMTISNNLDALKSISAWNLPLSVLREYERKGVKQMFDWQVQCLCNPKILFEHCNLVYSAPTSAGKTLVSEILLLKTVLERGKKVLLILPFISVVREKMFYLQDLLTAAGYRVEGFFGGYTPPGGFDSINVAICTIEKANSIVNKLLEQGKLDEIGTVVVDEVHLISDPGRGYILELLLAKILYMSQKYALQIQVITMSATLANVQLLQKWLNAELFITDFRPVALNEMIKVGNKIYDNNLKVIRSITEPSVDIREPFPTIPNDSDHVAQLCLETLIEGCSVIVFCPSKDWCENLAIQLAGNIHAIGKQGGEWGIKLKAQLNREAIDDVKQQLKDIPTGLDTVLEKTVTYGCAFHHAGLTTEERDIVEASFKSGALKIIVATSTLSSGVNLPARRVLIRSPLFGGKQMSSLTYRQMIGRAGRTGKDTLGESILICTESNARVGKELVMADLKPIYSCLEMDSNTHLKRALLEVISSGVATTKEDLDNFVKCTLLSAQKQLANDQKEGTDRDLQDECISEALDFLIEYEFVRLQNNEETNEQCYVATRLGMACLASSMPPTDGLILFAELQKSRRCFVLESELHAVYLVTPYSVCYQLQDLDWLFFLDLFEKLTPAMKKVGELVGIKESFLVRAMRGQSKLDYKLIQIHKRFYTALALQELVNEVPINTVASKYKCSRGMLQSLQQMASTFAGIVTSFCNSLQWDTLSLIVSQFKERLYFGVHRDLIDLMRIPDLNHKRARALFDAGITSLVDLANADVLSVEKILYNALSFDSAKQHDNENAIEAAQRNEARNFYITGKAGITVAEASKMLVQEARRFVQYEIGVGNINWSQQNEKLDENGETQNGEELHMSCEENKFNGMENKKIDMKNVEVGNKNNENCNKENGNKVQRKSEEATNDQPSKRSEIKSYPEKLSKERERSKSSHQENGARNSDTRSSRNNENNTLQIKEKSNTNSKHGHEMESIKPLSEDKNTFERVTAENFEAKDLISKSNGPYSGGKKWNEAANNLKSADKISSGITKSNIEPKNRSSSEQLTENNKNMDSPKLRKSNEAKPNDFKSKDAKVIQTPNQIFSANLSTPKTTVEPLKPKEKRKSSEPLPLDNNDVTPPKLRKSDENNKAIALDDGEKPSTSKKAQRLLRAKQLSEMKKQEWAKKREEEDQGKQNPAKENVSTKQQETNKASKVIENPMENGVGISNKMSENKAEKKDQVSQNPISENNVEKRGNIPQKSISNGIDNKKESTPNIITTNGDVFKTPNTNTPRSSHERPQNNNSGNSNKVLRRSPRNKLISSTRIDYQTTSSKIATPPQPTAKKPIKPLVKSPGELFNDDNDDEESFVFNTGVNEAIKKVENNHGEEKNILNQSQEDEIPSSQQLCEDVNTNKTHSPHASRFLRSLRATQRGQSPMTKGRRITPEPPAREVDKKKAEPTRITTENKTESPPVAANGEPSSSSSNIELSDFSMENSLMKNPMHLNASHILSCSKVEPDCSSFKSIDIIDICGDQQLFKGAFKEFMNAKRLGFCLGIQQQVAKRKPIIGANLLLNQAAAADRDNEARIQNIDFQIDDTNYLAGIGFCISENLVYYMNMQTEGTCKGLTPEVKCKYLRMLLRSQEHCLIVYDAKEQFKIVRKLIKDLGEIATGLEDPKVANWLLQPDKMHNLHSLAQQFAPECSALVNLCGSGRGYNSYGLDSDSAILAKVRCSIESCVTIHIIKGQIENLERIGTGQLHKFFKELEMPLQISFCNMEDVGFPTSSEALHKLFQQMVDAMKRLEAKIYELHGSKFNLGSSSAVARVLGLHRKTNGRVSTSKQILEKIDTPISQMIITYRKISVTLTKNIQPLLKCVQDERIHGQSITYTSTGRISMTEPNLQNVAKDFDVEIGSDKFTISCRSAFYPRDSKRCLISSDFCQLEMRILAHLSQDAALMQVMKSDRDVFVAIAARWNKIPEQNVSEQIRNGTKQICYGIVYGMGMRALAEGLKCTEQEANFVSEQFHAAYPGIRTYIDKVVKFARNNGYIETITGRRRYLEHINSGEASMKNQAERQAVNSTIQGSAADIAKSAILRMEKNITKYRTKLGIEPDSVRLVLHLHDELIFEVPEDKAKKIAKVLSITMENCVKLNVPLKVKLKIGKSWGDLKEVKL